jgi:hypothetical protein
MCGRGIAVGLGAFADDLADVAQYVLRRLHVG